jgi:hypothetical protein
MTQKKPRRRFVSLTVEEVSLVSDPACPPATVRIIKARRRGDTPEMIDLIRALEAVERARRLSVLEASEALYRGSRGLFARAGVETPLALARAVVERRRRGDKP